MCSDHEDHYAAVMRLKWLIAEASRMEGLPSSAILHEFELLGVVPFLVSVSIFFRVTGMNLRTAWPKITVRVPHERLQQIECHIPLTPQTPSAPRLRSD